MKGNVSLIPTHPLTTAAYKRTQGCQKKRRHEIFDCRALGRNLFILHVIGNALVTAYSPPPLPPSPFTLSSSTLQGPVSWSVPSQSRLGGGSEAGATRIRISSSLCPVRIRERQKRERERDNRKEKNRNMVNQKLKASDTRGILDKCRQCIPAVHSWTLTPSPLPPRKGLKTLDSGSREKGRLLPLQHELSREKGAATCPCAALPPPRWARPRHVTSAGLM